MAGKLDLNKIVGAARQREVGIKPGSGVTVVDRIALRQSWASPGDASYWVDILWDSSTNQKQTYRNWRFYKKSEDKWIEGHVWSGKATENDEATKEHFERTVTKMLMKGYQVDERQQTHRSPAYGLKFDGARPVQAEMITEAEDPTPAIYRRTKGSHDWW